MAGVGPSPDPVDQDDPDPGGDVPVALDPTHRVRTTRRRGRMNLAKWSALEALAPAWGLTFERPHVVDAAGLRTAFGRDAPRLLDVGTGSGEATRHWAAAHPDHDVLALELHRPGLARLLLDLDRDGPPNVRAAEADVTVVVDALAARHDRSCFEAVRVLFPDPWPKRRHTGRRLVDHRFASQVADLLPDGGTFHVATDWDDYAHQVRAALTAEPRFEIEIAIEGGAAGGRRDADGSEGSEGSRWVPAAELAGTIGPVGSDDPPTWCSPRPDRPVTAYERRGLQAGRTVTDLVARRR